MNQEHDEITIDLADLLAHILHRWKTIGILTLVLMVLCGVLMSYRDYKSIRNKYQETTVEALKSDMTDAQVTNVEQMYARYLSYVQRLADLQYYIDHSLLMRMDPNNSSKYQVEYLVKTDYEGVIESFRNSSFDLNIYQQMNDVISSDTDPRFVYELINLNGSIKQDTDSYIFTDAGDPPNDTYTGILTLSIRSIDKDKCEQLAKIADIAILQHAKELQNTGIIVSISNLSTSYTEVVDSALADYQRSTTAAGSDLYAAYQKFESSAASTLDEQEQALFTYLIDKSQNKIERIQWKKWLILGFAAGLFLGLFVVIMQYFVSPGIKTENDISRLIDSPLLGVIREAPTSKAFFGKRIHKLANSIECHGKALLSEDVALSILCDRVMIGTTEKKAKTIYLVKTVEHGYAEDILDRIISYFTEQEITVLLGNPSAHDNDLQKLKTADIALLVICTKSTLADTISTDLAICSELHLPILGHIIIHPQS